MGLTGPYLRANGIIFARAVSRQSHSHLARSIGEETSRLTGR